MNLICDQLLAFLSTSSHPIKCEPASEPGDTKISGCLPLYKTDAHTHTRLVCPTTWVVVVMGAIVFALDQYTCIRKNTARDICEAHNDLVQPVIQSIHHSFECLIRDYCLPRSNFFSSMIIVEKYVCKKQQSMLVSTWTDVNDKSVVLTCSVYLPDLGYLG